VDYYHNVYVTDRDSHCILKYDRMLEYIAPFGTKGRDDNQFIEPRGIAIWKRFGQVFIAEKGGAQYYWVGNGLKKAGLAKGEGIDQYTVVADVLEFGFMTLLHVYGADTTFLLKRKFMKPGMPEFSFRDARIASLKPASFLLRIEPTYSSYTYNYWEYPVFLNSAEGAQQAAPLSGAFVRTRGGNARGNDGGADIEKLKQEIKKHRKEE
jgi:hypothetical protein